MLDKFGRDENKDVKNLVFKEGEFANDYILFNAKEYFVTTSYQSDPTGSKLRIDRYHYNDIVSVKLNENNGLVWARNINKSQVTQGDAAFTQYSSFTKDNNTYFFISTASENPQQLSHERIVVRRGLRGDRNVL